MKIEKLIILLPLMTILFAGPARIYGQDSSGEDGKGEIRPLTGETVKDTGSGETKTGTVVENGKNTTGKSGQKAKTAPNPKEKDTGKDDRDAKAQENQESWDNINNSVLQITDGDYRYVRIPGYVTGNGKKTEAGEEKVEKDKVPEKIDLQELKEKEAYGKKKERSDLVAKAGLVLLIILIFVLYRIRSKKSGSSRIFKRYPK